MSAMNRGGMGREREKLPALALGSLTVDVFQSRIGERFRIVPRPEQIVEAELIEARVFGGAAKSSVPDARRRVPFALVFRARPVEALPQRIYRFEHEEIGPYDIFLVPVGPDATGMLYEAIFT